MMIDRFLLQHVDGWILREFYRDRSPEATLQRSRLLIEILCPVVDLAGKLLTRGHVADTDIVLLVDPVDGNGRCELRELRLHNWSPKW